MGWVGAEFGGEGCVGFEDDVSGWGFKPAAALVIDLLLGDGCAVSGFIY